jgi:heme/copper-type cytochrome/quinol oxidase subunit 1
MLSEKIGKWHFWLMVVGFNGTFFVMHLLGVFGMPRRVWTYPHGMAAVAWLNFFSSVSAFLLAFSIMLFIWNLFYSISKGKLAGDNPWDAWTLEWATSSPPPPENFERVPPIFSRRPLWDQTHGITSFEGIADWERKHGEHKERTGREERGGTGAPGDNGDKES